MTKANIQSAVDSLRNLGMGDIQIEEVKRTRQLSQNIMLTAPATGFVLARNVSPGQRFERGTEWYRIADLRRVWIMADIFENEARYVRPGTKARVSLPQQDEAFQARVSDVLPQFDPATRTLKVRLEADNPGYALRPDMFVDVELPIAHLPAVTVRADAALDSGLNGTVFVDRGDGFFEPRAIRTGWRAGGRIQILEGLESGERIAVSGTFLLDSESRMKLAAAGFSGSPAKDPVCDMDVDAAKAKVASRASEYRGKAYYFCSDQCKIKFDKAPEQYLGNPAGGRGRREGHSLQDVPWQGPTPQDPAPRRQPGGGQAVQATATGREGHRHD